MSSIVDRLASQEASQNEVPVAPTSTTQSPHQIKERQQFLIDNAQPTCNPDALPPHTVFDTIVKINISREGEIVPYTIHQGLLRFYSSFFRAKLKTVWVASDDTIAFDDCDEETMDCINAWLYTGSLFLGDRAFPLRRRAIALLLKVWVFADKYGMPALQNAYIDDIRWQFQHRKDISPFDHFAYLSQHTAKDSKLRRLVLDVAASGIPPSTIPTARQMENGLSFDLLKMMLSNNRGPQALGRLREQISIGIAYKVGPSWAQFDKSYTPAVLDVIVESANDDVQSIMTLWKGRSAEEQRLNDYKHGYRYAAASFHVVDTNSPIMDHSPRGL